MNHRLAAMQFSHPEADIFVPAPNEAPDAALRRVTDLCIAAHQDDIEIMAHAGISDCLDRPGRAFGGVVVTDGAGSPRSGPFADYTAEAMRVARRHEQRTAAELGRYAIQLQLAHPTADVKAPGHAGVAKDLATIFAGCRPEVVYLHNPADKHDTHIAVLHRCIAALRALPAADRPARVLGCEVWRDLDWLPDEAKVALDSGRHPELATRLLAAFASQISGGKRYDLAAVGRRLAHATFHTARATDRFAGITWAIDLTPVIQPDGPDLAEFTTALTTRFAADVTDRIKRWA
jgi:LmbE family N-acetylglucosaminyl deacetylase